MAKTLPIASSEKPFKKEEDQTEKRPYEFVLFEKPEPVTTQQLESIGKLFNGVEVLDEPGLKTRIPDLDILNSVYCRGLLIRAEQIITAGNVNFQLRPQISYIVSRRLNFNMYFDRTFNDPLVSNSFRRATTSGGVQVKFNLAE